MREREESPPNEKEPRYRIVFGGLWAFVVRGSWSNEHDEVHAFAINARRSAAGHLCAHYPTLTSDTSSFESACVEKTLTGCRGAIARLLTDTRSGQPTNREILVPTRNNKIAEALAMPLSGRRVEVRAQGSSNGRVTVHSSFCSVIDMNQANICAAPTRTEWLTRMPEPQGLVLAHVVLRQGELQGASPTCEKVPFKSQNGDQHEQVYCRRVWWHIPSKCPLDFISESAELGTRETLTLSHGSSDTVAALSNYCHVSPKARDAEDVIAFYDLGEEMTPIGERLYPITHDLFRCGNRGSGGDFCPPSRSATSR